MKIRNGFVSNSSSSSFCIIGIENRGLIKELSVAENRDFKYDEEKDEYGDTLDYGRNEGEKFLVFYGSYEPDYVGLDIESFGEDKSISQMKEELIKEIADVHGILVPKENISLIYGEAGE